MKKIFGRGFRGISGITGITVFLGILGLTLFLATPVMAAAPNWDISGTWVINVEYQSVNYPETLVLTQSGGNINGVSLNTIPPTSASAFTVIGGSVSGDTIVINAKQDTTSLVVDMHGTISTGGLSMSGNWEDVAPGTRTGTWSTTSGTAKKIVAICPTNKDQCKKDGWKDFGVFKNQGDCVSFVATGGKNLPTKNLVGTWLLSVNGGAYMHDMFIDIQKPDGTFSGHGGYPAGTGPTYAFPYNWKMTGTLSCSIISMTITYENGYTATISGFVNATFDGMSGGAGTGGVSDWSASRV